MTAKARATAVRPRVDSDILSGVPLECPSRVAVYLSVVAWHISTLVLLSTRSAHKLSYRLHTHDLRDVAFL
jgi:hypothetical protein